MPKWIGPFTVSKLVGIVAVKLDLPHPWTIHPVFHVSLIKPYHANGSVQPPGPLAYIDGDPQYAVDYILNQRIVKKVPPSLLCLSLFVCRGRRYALQE